MTTRLLPILFLLSAPLHADAQVAEKTFSKAFNVDGKKTTILDLPGTIEVKIWENTTVRIEILVTLASGNGSMLNELAHVGRYNLTSKPEGSALLIQAPNLQKQVRVKGEVLKETVSFTVYVPKTLAVELPNTGTAAVLKK